LEDEPVGPPLDGVVKREQHPGHTALSPNRLVGVDQRAVAVKGGEKAAALLIDRTRKPEPRGVVEQAVAIDGQQLASALGRGEIGRHR